MDGGLIRPELAAHPTRTSSDGLHSLLAAAASLALHAALVGLLAHVLPAREPPATPLAVTLVSFPSPPPAPLAPALAVPGQRPERIRPGAAARSLGHASARLALRRNLTPVEPRGVEPPPAIPSPLVPSGEPVAAIPPARDPPGPIAGSASAPGLAVTTGERLRDAPRGGGGDAGGGGPGPTTPPEPIDTRLPPQDYPAEALRAGVEGVVRLRLHVDAKGRVVSAQVLEDPGFGLGPGAARSALARFRFRPALRGGLPVEADLLFRVRYELP